MIRQNLAWARGFFLFSVDAVFSSSDEILVESANGNVNLYGRGIVMAFFERTSAVIDKTIKDLRRLSFWVYIFVQVIFLGLYTFKIYMSRAKLVYLIIYSILAGLSLLGFLYFLITLKVKKDRRVVLTKRSIRFAKYSANAAMIVVLLVEFAQGGVSDLSIILSGISMASFVLQISIECARILYEHYAELLTIALEKDAASLEPITHPLKAIDVPLAALSAKLNGTPKKELSEKERYVENLKSDYQSKKEEGKAKRRAEDQKQIKEHWAAIKGALKKKIQHPKKEIAPTSAPPKRLPK
jgi:hypothetical protein